MSDRTWMIIGGLSLVGNIVIIGGYFLMTAPVYQILGIA